MLEINQIIVIESFDEGGINTSTSIEVFLENFNQSQIKTRYERIDSIVELEIILKEILIEYTGSNYAPILHLEMHGEPEGLLLKSGEIYEWERLYEKTIEINIATKMSLLLFLGVCYSFNIFNPLQDFEKAAPFFAAFVGVNEIFTPELLNTYEIFYKSLFNMEDIYEINSVVQKVCRNNSYPNLSMIAATTIFERAWRMSIKSEGKLSIHKKKVLTKVFERHKKTFFMLDLYPELEKDFDIRLSDLKKY